MLSKEEHVKLRTICDAYNNRKGTISNHEYKELGVKFLNTLPAALDALDEADEHASGMFREANEESARLRADRDHWKDRADAETKRADEAEARAEALERALRICAGKCYPCVHKDTSYEKCVECEMSETTGGSSNPYWQFDTARFTPAT